MLREGQGAYFEDVQITISLVGLFVLVDSTSLGNCKLELSNNPHTNAPVDRSILDEVSTSCYFFRLPGNCLEYF